MRCADQKIGMFGLPDLVLLGLFTKGTGFLGDQVRGFGFTHDGSINLQGFNQGFVFSNLVSPNGFPITFGPEGELIPTPEGQVILDGTFDFMVAFDSNFAPIVGQQITLAGQGNPATLGRLDLLRARAEAGECDLVAQLGGGAVALGWLYDNGGNWLPDKAGQASQSSAVLRQIAQIEPVTFTCAPPGNGVRLALDRDEDGVLNRDE